MFKPLGFGTASRLSMNRSLTIGVASREALGVKLGHRRVSRLFRGTHSLIVESGDEWLMIMATLETSKADRVFSRNPLERSAPNA